MSGVHRSSRALLLACRTIANTVECDDGETNASLHEALDRMMDRFLEHFSDAARWHWVIVSCECYSTPSRGKYKGWAACRRVDDPGYRDSLRWLQTEGLIERHPADPNRIRCVIDRDGWQVEWLVAEGPGVGGLCPPGIPEDASPERGRSFRSLLEVVRSASAGGRSLSPGLLGELDEAMVALWRDAGRHHRAVVCAESVLATRNGEPRYYRLGPDATGMAEDSLDWLVREGFAAWWPGRDWFCLKGESDGVQ